MKNIKRLLAGLVLMSCTCTVSQAKVNWEEYEFHPAFQLQYSTSTVVLGSENFDRAINDKVGCVVFFYAPWCGPCRIMMPVIEELPNDFPSVVIGKLNVDAEKDICNNYRIKNIPTTMFFKNGQMVNYIEGVRSKSVLEDKIQTLFL